MYPDAIKIRLAQDNLNTHNASAFYHMCPPMKPMRWQSGASSLILPSQQAGSI